VVGELPESPLEGSGSTRSFDCVVVRVADDNFAQDDMKRRVTKLTAIEFASAVTSVAAFV